MDDASSDDHVKAVFTDWICERSTLEKLPALLVPGLVSALLQAFRAGWKAAEGANVWSGE